MKKRLSILLFLLAIPILLNAQEYLTGTGFNPRLREQKPLILKKASGVTLPFTDDFSYTGYIYPADSLWEDRDVFINAGYPINPPSVGVATFDAMNDTGAIYPWATPTPFPADFLTSLPIRLDSVFSGTPAPITPADSVYLSFYYQPQGVADVPSYQDSLVLDFWDPVDSVWIKKWGTRGMALDTFLAKYNRYFRLVMLPITETKFLKKDFRFRFRNYASIASNNLPSWQSNVDEWNLDYVYLNTGRSKNDTVFPDVTFVDPAPSILRNYRQMPARQFTNADLADTLRLKMSNLNNILNNILYQYVVKQVNGSFTHTKSGGVYDIKPFITNGYHDYPLHTKPAVDFTLPGFAGQDSAVFEITHMIGINGWNDNIIRNDTIRYRQEFYNSFAYDDGSAENGYGLAGINSKLAYEFKLNTADTLGGFQVYFNQTLSSAAYKYFYFMVWTSISPETMVYKSKRLAPHFNDSINAFYTYLIDDTTLILDGTFYIGWMQTADENLNVGFDRNSNAQNHLYYNVEGFWEGSSFNGALMMRPMMGKSWQPKKQEQKPELPENPEFGFTVFPNPTTGPYIQFLLPANFNTPESLNRTQIEVFNNLGQLVLSAPYTSTLNTGGLRKGIYTLRMTNYFANQSATRRLIINR